MKVARFAWAAVVAALLFAIPTTAFASHGTDPARGTQITLPAAEGSPTFSWEGLVTPSTGSQAVCVNGANAYYFYIHLALPAGYTAESYYNTFDATLTARIDWDPTPGTATTQDLTLWLAGPDSAGIRTTSDEKGRTTEVIVDGRLSPGVYRLIACAVQVVLPQQFRGVGWFTVVKKTTSDVPPPPEDGDRGMRFSATTISDPQRDVAEPSLRIDGKGNIYTCGPFGASRAAEYAAKSEDGGDTFRVLGQAPEGRIATGGGGDCELAVSPDLNALGNHTLSYTGLEALVNFSTGRSLDEGKSFVGTNAAPSRPGVDRQWMEASRNGQVFLGYNEVAFGYQVQRSVDGGLTYEPPVTAATGIFRPGPIRIDLDPSHNPLYNPLTGENDEIIYFTYTKGSAVWVARSYNEGKTWENFPVATGFNANNLFPVLAIDTAGNLYAAWTEKGTFNAYYAYSLRPASGPGGAGETWSGKRLINRAPVLSTVMPWIEAGDPGRVVVSYYGSEGDGNIEVGSFRGWWDIYVSTSFNALETDPTLVRFALTKATTHPVHWDSICVSGLGCNLAVPPGDRTLLDFFQNRLDPKGYVHVTFNQSNKIPRASVGRIAIVTYVKQIAGPGLYASATPTADPRPVVRNSSVDHAGDARFPFSTFGAPPLSQPNVIGADIKRLTLTPVTGTGVEPGTFQIALELANASDSALLQALQQQAAGGSPAGSMVYAVRFFSGTDPYSAVAKWTPGVGFRFGFGGLSMQADDKLETYPGLEREIAGCRSGNTLLMTVSPSFFKALDLPATPAGEPVIRPAAAGDRVYDVTAFVFGNASAFPEVQSYMNLLDATAAFDYVAAAGTAAPAGCAPEPPPTAGTPGRVSGGGTISADGEPLDLATLLIQNGKGVGNKAHFNLRVELAAGATAPSGHVKFTDREGGMEVVSTSLRSLVISGNHATITGVAKVNGVDGQLFQVDVDDLGEPGSADTFRISVPGRSYSAGGVLVGGNIQVKQ